MNAIIVDSISKKFKIPHEKKTTLFQNIVGVLKRQFDYEEFWALKDVSFEVKKGEAFGIIGRNGSGKSTLLKILAKVLYPDTGSITMNGKTASFLELGVGFQPELTAKENVYIYASVLGISRKQVDRIYDDIFDFAELRKFENMKLKNFSSGMYMRLAFATAIHINPDTLLIDEVFAVGDEAFQKKCAARINDFKEQGKTIIFVSHDLKTVRNLCQRSMLLNEGRIVSIGDTEKVIVDYLNIINPQNNFPGNTEQVQWNASIGRMSGKLSQVSPPNIQRLIGADQDTDIDAHSEPNYFVLSKYIADKTGIIHEMRIKCSFPGHIKIAIYADDNGAPGTLLNAINFDISVSTGWNGITFRSTPIRAGTSYWLAFCADKKTAGTKSTSHFNRRFKPADYSSFKFPDPAGTNFTIDTDNFDVIAGWEELKP